MSPHFSFYEFYLLQESWRVTLTNVAVLDSLRSALVITNGLENVKIVFTFGKWPIVAYGLKTTFHIGEVSTVHTSKTYLIGLAMENKQATEVSIKVHKGMSIGQGFTVLNLDWEVNHKVSVNLEY